MELEQESRPLSSNTTVEKDHITWPLSFEKIAEQTTFQSLCFGTKVNKALSDIPICIYDSTFYQMSLQAELLRPSSNLCTWGQRFVLSCSCLPACLIKLHIGLWLSVEPWNLGHQEIGSRRPNATSSPCLFLRPSFSFVIGEIFLLFPCFLWWSHTGNQDLPPPEGKSQSDLANHETSLSSSQWFTGCMCDPSKANSIYGN